ncbi:3-dehydroquinate dehydratase II [Candidatus Kinetoplastibacterium oncopeltii TCC290E]|uniref:3-dehydroquinate dehydratase n=1 Tax=Candidatus Kinetoplastidibacterium stringomonadis TCC290E TaxID=1208920 RepID=M1LSS2_9PROT|nr:type II 3-dehydroquinate dehydratase [Candidatus Kinetoplastibacterium oncopeltii]AGF48597.1 3-dehydroquinate dehydratase II [Candidatus Kinetoplastibacterium oncopeltii TCC290E]
MAKNILVLHGPNLNLLGVREPTIYGNLSLSMVDSSLRKIASEAVVDISIMQSNHEGHLVDIIHDSRLKKNDFLIINAGAYTHTSIALRDAISAVSIPFIEVHISNVYKRESFRNFSYLSDIAIGVISGLGINGYEAALRYAINY